MRTVSFRALMVDMQSRIMGFLELFAGSEEAVAFSRNDTTYRFARTGFWLWSWRCVAIVAIEEPHRATCGRSAPVLSPEGAA